MNMKRKIISMHEKEETLNFKVKKRKEKRSCGCLKDKFKPRWKNLERVIRKR